MRVVLERAGGLDLAVLGIGRNGHIAFNEPRSAFDSRTRRVRLDDVTREQYVAAFANLAKTNNTLIVPSNLSDLAGLVATATTVFKTQEK